MASFDVPRRAQRSALARAFLGRFFENEISSGSADLRNSCATTGLRVAAALPADVRARWIFDAVPVPVSVSRTALRRTLLTLGVLPAVAAVGGAVLWGWGAARAAAHVAIDLAFGVLLVEALMVGAREVPCTAPWRPERAHLRGAWPAYLAAALVLPGLVPTVARVAAGSFTGVLTLAALLALAAWLVRRRESARAGPPPDEPDASGAPGVLRLD